MGRSTRLLGPRARTGWGRVRNWSAFLYSVANFPWLTGWSTPNPPPLGGYATEVTFDAPGTYVLGCLASYGAIGASEDVTVTVVQ